MEKWNEAGGTTIKTRTGGEYTVSSVCKISSMLALQTCELGLELRRSLPCPHVSTASALPTGMHWAGPLACASDQELTVSV